MQTTTFLQGQRVVAPAEPQLGLGVVTEREGRRLSVLFPKADLTRTYSNDTTALHRFLAKPGDRVRTEEGTEEVVVGVEEGPGGLVSYRVESGRTLSELALSMDLGQTDPFALLAVGRPGSPADFLSRTQAYELRAVGRSQEHRGLGSARVELLPHQMFVAERVAKMWRPRVLLADEVGLGKTVEAGLIAVRLAALGRTDALAVVVPRALIGQWLAEFFRRFARPLTLFDPEMTELPQDLLIAADDLDFLPANFSRELLIVDEAHHYHDDETLRVLAERSQAVLFLSATPSLGGEDSLFKLLHRLDPLRYPGAEELKIQSQQWSQVADLARDIESGLSSQESVTRLRQTFPDDDDLIALAEEGATEELLQRLVDRHGLGRSLIRNRRARLENLFSARRVVTHELETGGIGEFLVSFLLERRANGEKVLVMVESPQEVILWAGLLAEETNLSVARFDESMSLLERDRQAAWFNRTTSLPGEEEPASVLLCSSLGGEGRNFQVAHHLLLLGLPRHPDKLEQRIGRLDRIGQKSEVTIHVPLPEESPVSLVRFNWLHRGLDAFHRPFGEGQTAFQQFGDELERWEKQTEHTEEFEAWVDGISKWAHEARERSERSVDPLIDRVSFDETRSERLTEKVREEQQRLAGELSEVLPELLDSLGVVLEPRGDEGAFFIKPGEMMFVEALPGLSSDGTLVTFKRELANRRDDIEFLHFEHRLVQNTLDLILEEGVGRATAARWKGAPTTTVLFQFLYVLEAEGPQRLSLGRFFPTRTEVVTGDLSGAIALGSALPGGSVVKESSLERLAPEVVDTLLTRTSELRGQLEESAQALLEELVGESRRDGVERAMSFFDTEEARLTHLHEAAELEELVAESLREVCRVREETKRCLESMKWRFDAVRMVLCQE